eukprot:TRINITY_DN8833_c0_g1_i1.p1 TRINITY_DN8833_c0_g1~~TRINITY_DN8833_c0_g1_i1.p1  ORF type:complete len:170 (+),score=32.36 TRINITY_DN8833_c0_g1_i1:47-511(+)
MLQAALMMSLAPPNSELSLQDFTFALPTRPQLQSDCKMVMVVRTDLNMGVGKIASQCCHAAVGLYRKLLREQHNPTYAQFLMQWENEGEKKIVLKAKSEEELLALQRSADEHHLPSYLIADAGRTQIAPGSTTVLSIAGISSTVDKVTGHLKLM